jgi:hypothetical protein
MGKNNWLTIITIIVEKSWVDGHEILTIIDKYCNNIAIQ